MTMLNRFLFLFVVFPSLLFSQSYKISGRVYDVDREMISHFIVIDQNNQDNLYISNNKDGKYEIKIETTNKAMAGIRFEADGYTPFEVNFSRLVEDIYLDVVMTKTRDLDSVTVSAQAASRTISMFVDVFDLRRRSYLLDSSIESMISFQSGVSSTNELSSQYLVRGGNFDENIIYVNGVEMYRPLLIRTAQQEGLSFINPNMVQKVAFSSGGFAAEYGDKMSSVLDVVYKQPAKFEGSVSMSNLENGIYIGNSTKRFSQMSSIRHKTTESQLKTTDTKAEYKPVFLDFQTYITFKASERVAINLFGNHSNNSYQFTPQTRSTSFGTLDNVRNFKIYFNGWENDYFRTTQAAMNVNFNVSDKMNWIFTGSIVSSQEEERYDIDGSYRLTENFIDGVASSADNLLGVGGYVQHARNKLDVDIYKLSHQGNYAAGKHFIKWGLSVQKERIKDKVKEWEMRDSIGYSLPWNGEFVNVFSNLKSNNQLNSTRFSGFLQDRYQISTSSGLFGVTAGVRASYWDFNEEFLVSPRLSFTFIPTSMDYLTFRLAGGMYYQAPFYKEYQRIVNEGGNNVICPNRDIKSQKSIHYIVGGDYNFRVGVKSFKLSSEMFYKQLSDLIPYTVNNVKIRYSGVNEGKGYIGGMDVKLHGDFVEGTSNWISLSLMKTQQEVNGIKSPLPTDQLYNATLFLQDYMPGYDRLKMNIKGSITQGLPTLPPHSTFEKGYFRSTPYKRLDFGLTWELLGEDYKIRRTNAFWGAFKNIWLGADIYNVFDFKNINTYYWVTDVLNNQYAVPNYLTGRQLNIKLLADF